MHAHANILCALTHTGTPIQLNLGLRWDTIRPITNMAPNDICMKVRRRTE